VAGKVGIKWGGGGVRELTEITGGGGGGEGGRLVVILGAMMIFRSIIAKLPGAITAGGIAVVDTVNLSWKTFCA